MFFDVGLAGNAFLGHEAGVGRCSVEDAEFDHRVAADAEHEQLAVTGEVDRNRQQFLDVLLGEDVGAGGDVTDDGMRQVADLVGLTPAQAWNTRCRW